MRTAFREWYPPSQEELQELWSEALVVLDANVLLGLYRYPEPALKEFFAVLRHLADRLWLPHQVGVEFQRNREALIPQQRAVLKNLIKEVGDLYGKTERLSIPDYHPVLKPDIVVSEQEEILRSIDAFRENVQESLEQTPGIDAKKAISEDSIFDEVTTVYDGRLGPPFEADRLERLAAEGHRRYGRSIPPGFKDAEKDETLRYNDFYIWKQILEHAKSTTPPSACIFVTNDRKADWWRRRMDTLLGPRTELTREYLDEVGAQFFMYTPEDFLAAAKQFLQQSVSASTIEAVRDASKSRPVRRLRTRRMALPPLDRRLEALNTLFDLLEVGKVSVIDDLNEAIHELGEDFHNQRVAVPLFFSLVNSTYGPVKAGTDDDTRLRDRRIAGYIGAGDRERFLEAAHVAWLAQALFRISNESFDEDELLTAFFGADPPAHAPPLLLRAQDAAERDQ